MRRSTDRIVTTHAGSLPRPDDLVHMMASEVDAEVFNTRAATAVREAVQQQIAAGIDVISDGEQGKVGFVNYIAGRMSGFAHTDRPSVASKAQDMLDFPEIAAQRQSRGEQPRSGSFGAIACVGPISYADRTRLDHDIENFHAALRTTSAEQAFLTAVSPGAVVQVVENTHYRNRREYLFALAAALRTEYAAILDAGFVLQVDAPDLAMSRHVEFAGATLEHFRTAIAEHVEALNTALQGLPSDRIRLHVCWGNYGGPHHRDVALRDIVDIVLDARVGAISFEAANPRHEHEWRVWRDVQMPQELVLIPGVIDTRVNYIEHPELVAERIARYAEIVGPARVIAGTDCGFATSATNTLVFPRVAYAKLQSLAEGARLASRLLF